jgi:hypothetical protein
MRRQLASSLSASSSNAGVSMVSSFMMGTLEMRCNMQPEL